MKEEDTKEYAIKNMLKAIDCAGKHRLCRGKIDRCSLNPQPVILLFS